MGPIMPDTRSGCAVGNQAGGTAGFSGWGGQFVASGDYSVSSVDLGPPGFDLSDTLHIFVIGPEVTFSFR